MRGFFGGIILFLFGIPTLFVVTIAVGLVDAMSSTGVIEEVATNAIGATPGMVERAWAAAQEPGAVQAPNTKAWIDTMSRASKPLPTVLEESGLYDWMRDQLTPVLISAGAAFRGEVSPDEIMLDLRPLKRALTSRVVIDYGTELLSLLPACDEAGIAGWRAFLDHHAARAEAAEAEPSPAAPACSPDPRAVPNAVELYRRRVEALPDERPLTRDEDARTGAHELKIPSVSPWALFVLPSLFILIGAFIAGRGARGFLRWSGGTTVIGGLLALLAGSVMSGGLATLLRSSPGSWHTNGSSLMDTEAGRLLALQMADVLDVALSPIFSGVVTVAAVISGLGVALFVLGIIVPRPAAS